MNETLETTSELQSQITYLEEKINELTTKFNTVVRATFGSYSEVEEYLKQDETESKQRVCRLCSSGNWWAGTGERFAL